MGMGMGVGVGMGRIEEKGRKLFCTNRQNVHTNLANS